jgi:hypothetical protein
VYALDAENNSRRTILLAMPVLAQSSAVVRQINRYQEFRLSFAPELESTASGYLLYVGELSGRMYAGLQALLNDDEMAEMMIVFESVAANSQLYAQIAKEVGLGPDTKWVLTDGMGRLVMQGIDLPEPIELIKVMEDAGIKSPIRLLRDFIRQHPGHLDAHLNLLKLTLGAAEARTKENIAVGHPDPCQGVPQDK